MGKPFKLSLVSDVRDLLRGTKDTEEALDQVADSLDDLSSAGSDAGSDLTKSVDKAADSLDDLADQGKDAGKDVAKGLDKVTDSADEVGDETKKMERKFSDAVDSMKSGAKSAGKSIGDDVQRGTKEASEGVSEFKDEARDSAREAAASFSGEFDDVGDLVQETLANALAGFGPVGAAAGMAAAAGIGILISSLQASAEEAEETKNKVIDLANELAETSGDPAALDWASRLRDTLTEITDDKSWIEFWQDAPRTRLEEWSDAADTYGLSMSDMARSVTGDMDALARVYDDIDSKIAAAEATTQTYVTANGQVVTVVDPAVDALGKLRSELEEQTGVTQDAIALNAQMEDALAGIGDAAADSAQVTEDYQSSVVDSLTGAGEAWDQYVEDGKVNLSEYNAAIEAQAAAVESFEANLVTASSNLSQEALDYIRSLGPEAAPLLQAFVDAPLEEKQRTATNWDTLGRAATDGYKQSLKLDSATSSAVSAAQRTANGNPITFKTQLQNDLQEQINWAATTARIPTIRFPSKVQPIID